MRIPGTGCGAIAISSYPGSKTLSFRFLIRITMRVQLSFPQYLLNSSPCQRYLRQALDGSQGWCGRWGIWCRLVTSVRAYESARVRQSDITNLRQYGNTEIQGNLLIFRVFRLLYKYWWCFSSVKPPFHLRIKNLYHTKTLWYTAYRKNVTIVQSCCRYFVRSSVPYSQSYTVML